jgi:threonine synthase
MSSISINDELTAETIKKVYAEHAYLLDPHGAVAYAAAEKYLKSHSLDKAIILATAHPVKFNPTIKEILQIDLLKEMEKKFTENKEYYITEMEADYDSLKFFLKTL